MQDLIPVTIAAVPVTGLLPCPCPELPADGSLPPDPLPAGYPICGEDVRWLIGAQFVCDRHLRRTCELMGWDYDELQADMDAASGPVACPGCGDAGFVNPNDGRRSCGDSACSHTDVLVNASSLSVTSAQFCTCPHTLEKDDPGDPACPRHGVKRPATGEEADCG